MRIIQHCNVLKEKSKAGDKMRKLDLGTYDYQCGTARVDSPKSILPGDFKEHREWVFSYIGVKLSSSLGEFKWILR